MIPLIYFSKSIRFLNFFQKLILFQEHKAQEWVAGYFFLLQLSTRQGLALSSSESVLLDFLIVTIQSCQLLFCLNTLNRCIDKPLLILQSDSSFKHSFVYVFLSAVSTDWYFKYWKDLKRFWLASGFNSFLCVVLKV